MDSSAQETALHSILQWAGSSMQRLSSRLLAGAGANEGPQASGGSALLQVRSPFGNETVMGRLVCIGIKN